MHLVLMCGGPSLHLFPHYTEAKQLQGPCTPGGRRGPSPAAESWGVEPLQARQEPTETLSTMLIKPENTISWLIKQGKTPPFISEHNPKAFYKHVTQLSVKLRPVVKDAQPFFFIFNICSFISFTSETDVAQLFCS